MMKTRVLVVGAGGQAGRMLARRQPAGIECMFLDRAALDICEREQVIASVRELKPAAIINAAAYTAVDGAEREPDRAVAVNAEGADNLARAAAAAEARLIHISTDYVFSGEAERPYCPDDDAHPISVYGHSKLAGERRVLEILPRRSVALRTSLVYSDFSGNFAAAMLRRMQEEDELRVTTALRSSPAWARGLADALWRFAQEPEISGIFHWADGGECSRYEFACAIYEEARGLGLLEREVKITPVAELVALDGRPPPAPRPAYSALDCAATCERLRIEQRPWREQLRAMLEDMPPRRRDARREARS